MGRILIIEISCATCYARIAVWVIDVVYDRQSIEQLLPIGYQKVQAAILRFRPDQLCSDASSTFETDLMSLCNRLE